MSRRPLPTAIKQLHGNPGGRPLNEDEPKPDMHMPEPPAGMSEAAIDQWNIVAPQLHKMGVLSLLDATALQMYCESYAVWKDAQEHISKYGPVVKQQGRVMQSPYMQVAMTAQKEMRQLLIEFGMTPSSRSSLRVGTGSEKKETPKFKSVS